MIMAMCGGFASSAYAADTATPSIKTLPPSLAMNPNSELTQKATSAQDIAFLFYKLANIDPNLEQKITNTPSFKNASAEDQLKILRQDVPLLKMGFRNFVPQFHNIIIRTRVGSKVSIGQKNGIELSFGGDPKSPIYFPYLWGGDRLAVLADGIDQFKFLPMKLDTASRVSGKMDANGQSTLLLELKPMKADGSNQFPLDGVPQWLLLTKISKAWLMNNYHEVLWEYKAAP
jgi:hypothetical protein